MKKLPIRILTILFTLVLQEHISFAQDNHKSFSDYNGEQNISARLSVTLNPGFHIPPPPPATPVRIFTTGRSYVNCPSFVSSASSNQNYISTRVYKSAGIDPDNLSGRSICEVNETIQYFDGLGRPLQTVVVDGGLPGHDIVTPVGYDAFGRENIKYQPYSVWNNHGSYRADAIAGGGQAGYYNNPPHSSIAQTSNPSSLTVFEASPLNRVLEQGAPGSAWQPVVNSNAGHTVKMDYGTNNTGEVRLWTVNANGNGANGTGHYAAGRLYKTTVRDENWQPVDSAAGTTDEFKDFDGRVVLKRAWETTGKYLDTYYVYDDFSDLRYVLPPAVNQNTDRLIGGAITGFVESDPAFNDYIYGYRYDGRNRLIRKKVPGKGWEELIYNPLDQVVFSRDSVQAQRSERTFTKYDLLGRVTMTGVETGHTGTRDDVQATVNSLGIFWDNRSNAAGNLHGYDNVSAPSNYPNMQVDVVNYYDNYDVPGLPHNESASFSNMTRGLLVASKTRVLGTVNDYLWTVNYYDREGRVVKTYSQHYLDGTVNPANYDITVNSWNFDGSLNSSERTHFGNGVSTKIATRYEYDHMGRKVATFENINEVGEVALSVLAYNELGQLKGKKLHNEMQSTTMAYNERGWLRSSTSNEFSMELKYNDAVNGAAQQYNGNIANQLYNNGGTAGTFNYSYDRLNRLTIGEVSPNLLSERISYDVMGNINTLNRDGANPNLYHYNGNRLWYAEYFTNGYDYDANGNATQDGRNGMSLTYNQLNLPATANKPGMSLAYTYDATGRKLKKNANGSIRNYVDGIEYKPDNTIDFIHTGEGIARNSGGSYVYEYNLTDHLGNVRYSFNQNGTKLQSDEYYAFGKRKTPTFLSSTDNKYLYNGKELQEELDGQYDYGARFYDPVIARWNVVDPLTELHYGINPYNYVLNNPVLYSDEFGLDTTRRNKPLEVTIVGKRTHGNILVLSVPRNVPRALPSIRAVPPPNPFLLLLAALLLPSNYWEAQKGFRPGEMPPGYDPKIVKTENTVEDLIAESEKIPIKNQKDNEFYQRDGGTAEAEKDFESLGPENVQTKTNGTKVGKLSDGSTINVRSKSTDGRPTIEVARPNGTKIKFRYGN